MQKRSDAERIITYLVGKDGDIEDAMERVKMLENDRINHLALIKLHDEAMRRIRELENDSRCKAHD
jgi:hypothetical protein